MEKMRDFAKDMRYTRLYLKSNDEAMNFYKWQFFKERDEATLPEGVLEKLEETADGTLMDWQSPNWMDDSFDKIALPLGWPTTDEGDLLRF